MVDGKKMSKSLGNFYTVDEILKKNPDPKAFRHLVLSSHYRQVLNFTFKSLEASSNAIMRINNFLERIVELKETSSELENLDLIKEEIHRARGNFVSHMNNDLNTSLAIASFFDFITSINTLIDGQHVFKGGANMILDFVAEIDDVLGFMDLKINSVDLKMQEKIQKMIDTRNFHRTKNEWDKADAIRNKLYKLGIKIKDEGAVTKWRFN
jgi:cysteinyl-tRNA synthetase